LCERGTQAGLLPGLHEVLDEDGSLPEFQADEMGSLDFDLEQIGEISF
jgi:hypothetical protein